MASRFRCITRLSLLLSLIFLTAVGYCQVAVSPSTAPLTNSRCLINSGSSFFSFSFSSLQPSRSFSGLSYRYTSDKGWELSIPSFEVMTNGKIFLNDTACKRSVFGDSASGFFTSSGLRIRKITSGGYEIVADNGVIHSFSYQIQSPTGAVFWKLSKVSTRGGWETQYNYGNGGKLERVVVDYNPLIGKERYSIALSYDTSGMLKDVSINDQNQTRLRFFSLQNDGSKLTSITQVGLQGGQLEVYRFEYFVSGIFRGKLKKVVSLLGGEISMNYALVSLGGGYSKIALRDITTDNKEAGGVASYHYSYSGGRVVGREFYGFDDIKITYPSGQMIERAFYTDDYRYGLVKESFAKGSDGVVYAHKYARYDLGGQNGERYALRHLVVEQYADPANKTVRGIEVDWDFISNRVLSVTDYGQDEYDFVSGAFLNSYPDDNLTLSISYAPDNQNLNVYNQPSLITVSDNTGAKISESQYIYDGQMYIDTIKQWDSVSGTTYEARFSTDSLGNITDIWDAAGSHVTYSWSGDLLSQISLDPSGVNLTEVFSYFPGTNILQAVTFPSGVRREITLDEFLRLESAFEEAGGIRRDLYSASYDIANKTVSFTSSGSRQWYYLDGFGVPVKATTDAVGANGFPAIARALNGEGLLAKVSFPGFFSSSHQGVAGEVAANHGLNAYYDAMARINSVSPDTAGDGIGVSTINHSSNGRWGAPQVNPQGIEFKDPLMHRLEFGEFSTKSFIALGDGQERVEFERTESPFQTIVTDLLNNQSIVEYSSLGRITRYKDLRGVDTRYEYYINGLLKKVTLGDGKTREFSYDAAGRLGSVVYTDPATGDTEAVSIYWDQAMEPDLYVPKGSVAGLEGPYDQVHVGYDALGRLVELRHYDDVLNKRVFRFEYDSNGRLQTIYYPEDIAGGPVAVSYEYDNNGLEKAITSINFLYYNSRGLIRDIVDRTPYDRPLKVEWYNNVTEEFLYAPNSGLLTEHILKESDTGSTIYNTSWQYDDLNVTKYQDPFVTVDYLDYDTRNFLTTFSETSGGSTNTYSIGWDSYGRQQNDPKTGLQFVYSSQSQFPYLFDKLTDGNTDYNWQYNLNAQPVVTSGPKPEDNLTIEYAPDATIRKVTNSSGDTLEIYRGVFGDPVKIVMNSGGQSKTIRSYGLGFYDEVYDASGVKAEVFVYGERYDTGYGIISEMTFVPSTQGLMSGGGGNNGGANGSGGNGGGNGGPTVIKPNPVDPPNKNCGNGKIDPGEQCDGSKFEPYCNTVFPCANDCTCTPFGPPPDDSKSHHGDYDCDKLGNCTGVGQSGGGNEPPGERGPGSQFGGQERDFTSAGYNIVLQGPCAREKTSVVLAYPINSGPACLASNGTQYRAFTHGRDYLTQQALDAEAVVAALKRFAPASQADEKDRVTVIMPSPKRPWYMKPIDAIGIWLFNKTWEREQRRKYGFKEPSMNVFELIRPEIELGMDALNHAYGYDDVGFSYLTSEERFADVVGIGAGLAIQGGGSLVARGVSRRFIGRGAGIVLLESEGEEMLACRLLREPPLTGYKQATKILRDAGVSKEIEERVLGSFVPETMVVRTAGKGEYVLRWYDNKGEIINIYGDICGVSAKRQGHNLFRTFPSTRAGLALRPRWNWMTHIAQFQLREGAVYFEGVAARQGGFPGREVQIYVLDPINDLIDLAR